jgi:hypothetical protein
MSYGTSQTFPSKKTMKEAVEAGLKFYLFDTSLIGNKGNIRIEDIAEGQSVGPIVGPDVFRNRKWYATIERRNGTLRVK